MKHKMTHKNINENKKTLEKPESNIYRVTQLKFRTNLSLPLVTKRQNQMKIKSM